MKYSASKVTLVATLVVRGTCWLWRVLVLIELFFFSWIGLKPFKTTCKHRKQICRLPFTLPLEKSLDCHASGQVQVPAANLSLYFQSPEELQKKDLSHPQHACTTEGKTHECYFMYGSHNITQMCLVATFLEKSKQKQNSGCCVYHFNMTKSLAHCIWDVRLLNAKDAKKSSSPC